MDEVDKAREKLANIDLMNKLMGTNRQFETAGPLSVLLKDRLKKQRNETAKSPPPQQKQP